MEENTEVPLILGRPFLATGRAIIDVHQGQLILRVDEERVIFDMQKIMKYPKDESSSSCFQIDLLNHLADEYKDDQLITDSLERCLAQSGTTSDDDITIRKEAEILEKNSETEKVSLEEVQPKIELKTLPSHLKYLFLEPELFPVIISSSLTAEQEIKLMKVLREHKRALGWTIVDINGISPAICTHRILNYKPIVQPQRRLNPAMQEVVKKEVVKLLAAGHGFYYFLDGYSGYNQILIAPEDQEKTHSHAPKRCMSAIFSDMTEKFLEIFMDDFTIFGLPPPTTVKGIRSFLGHADNCRKAFVILKEHLTNAPIVISPDWSEPFEIMRDASDIAVGAILGQKRDKIFRPIYYANRTLNEAQKNYATTEKELLAVVFAFDKFRSYLIGMKVTVFTDHAALKYLLAKKDARPRLLR
uniref:Uncharacterized protein LOC104229180 n=1 Tax=Nicotiana sylvestris TaxID=4096 RepID=A0A1U7X0S2_NICSY|nr:PREDICTED: uncharacterized protein LOC104229180 [Nicotiana sylvestris]